MWTDEREGERAYQGRGCTEACSPQSRPVTRQKVGPLEETRGPTNGTGPSPGLYATAKRYSPAMIKRVLPTLNAMALSSWNRARKGNVTSSKFLRPNLSIVKKAGIAKAKLIMPTPIDHCHICQIPLTSCSRAVGAVSSLQGVLHSRCSVRTAERRMSSRLKH